MLDILAIDHIVLRTTKLDKMLHFYTQILGCHVERETDAGVGLTQLRAGNALIDIVTVDSELGAVGGGAPTKTERNVDHFCLQIKPISEQVIINHLKEHGIEAGEFASRYGAQGQGRSIYIEDPESNTVELRCRNLLN
ncbi:VOC family protein [Psychromonas sp. KJ10-2]|uniref:VOC family protein n=1 Tax=Psychromonas sp. KJ10-2 TaxID=3391822 RepID=UPI0039B42C1E